MPQYWLPQTFLESGLYSEATESQVYSPSPLVLIRLARLRKS